MKELPLTVISTSLPTSGRSGIIEITGPWAIDGIEKQRSRHIAKTIDFILKNNKIQR